MFNKGLSQLFRIFPKIICRVTIADFRKKSYGPFFVDNYLQRNKNLDFSTCFIATCWQRRDNHVRLLLTIRHPVFILDSKTVNIFKISRFLSMLCWLALYSDYNQGKIRFQLSVKYILSGNRLTAQYGQNLQNIRDN